MKRLLWVAAFPVTALAHSSEEPHTHWETAALWVVLAVVATIAAKFISRRTHGAD